MSPQQATAIVPTSLTGRALPTPRPREAAGCGRVMRRYVLAPVVRQGFPPFLIGRRCDEPTHATDRGGCACSDRGRGDARDRGASGTRGGAGGPDHVGPALYSRADALRAR